MYAYLATYICIHIDMFIHAYVYIYICVYVYTHLVLNMDRPGCQVSDVDLRALTGLHASTGARSDSGINSSTFS